MRLRTLIVGPTLPPAYLAHPDSSFPVLYMPDGGIGEDFPHIVNTLTALTEAGDVVPLIVVGIENTQRRRDLTGPTEVESDRKIAPVADESDVRPHTDAFAAILDQAAPDDLAWNYAPRPDLRHATIYRAESAAAFRAVFAPR